MNPRKLLNRIQGSLTPGRRLSKARPSGRESRELALRRRVALRAGVTVFSIFLLIVVLLAMTVAWYSNVAETKTITFTTRASSLQDWLSVTDELISALPGDSGTLSLTVENQDDRAVTLSVLALKEQLDEDWQKRIYFYVEGQIELNGELLERSYITAESPYVWTLQAGESLLLGQEEGEDSSAITEPQLCWEWVNDVLGYYVKATPERDYRGTLTGMSIQEYLCPIVYDYASAVFTEVYEQTEEDAEDSQGQLVGSFLTAVGSTTLQELLTQLTAADGYVSDTPAGYQAVEELPGWYCVSEEEGIYFYLCTAEEIRENNAFDTAVSCDSSGIGEQTVSLYLALARSTDSSES